MEINSDLVKKAYKKLKSSVYYDKTQLVLRNELVKFEREHPGDLLDKYLDKDIFGAFGSKNRFNRLVKKICSEIFVISLPKKIEDKEKNIIINVDSKEINVTELQHYIDMPVEGHLLGVLWIMLLGYRIDAKIYEHSYGNRIRKNLINEFSEEPTFSPYLFEPYFEQYESWRDKAMSEAQKHMGVKQDVAIITMDFRRYYYSLDVDENVLGQILVEFKEDSDDEKYLDLCSKLNSFVGDVISSYAKLFESSFDNRRILPIGFLPSNILGNWCLQRFDKAVVDGWNPVYYGRYVDDILIVDKIERNSDIYAKAKENELTRDDVIKFFLTSCSKWNGLVPSECPNSSKYSLIQKNEKLTEQEKERNSQNSDRIIYSVNQRYNPIAENNSEIVVHNDKVKIFYFKWDESDALITCFKSNISKNKSEFRHLPEDESVFQRDDYSEIYSLSSSDTVNKFRGINGVSLDKYELSKFLGKYLRIGGMIRDKAESKFEKDILKIFTPRAIIENYSVWEKITEILVINERFKALEEFCNKINDAIKIVTISDDVPDTIKDKVSKSLYIQLHASLCKSLSLVWKSSRFESQERIYEKFLKSMVGENADLLIDGYCESRMIDKSVMPIMYDMLDTDKMKQKEINLTCFDDCLSVSKKEWDINYKYYPYLIGMYDFSIVSCIEQMSLDKGSNPFDDLELVHRNENERYIGINYQVTSRDAIEQHEAYNLVKVLPLFDEKNDTGTFGVFVGDNKKHKLRVSIANVRLNLTNFERIIKGCPDRRYSRYRDLSQIVNLAIDQHSDMLIMPEAYVPFEWLPTLARTCAKNKLAIVTGVEHVKVGRKIFNFTATILPYDEGTHRCAYISFHLKKHYAPSEVEKITGYRLNPEVGNNYELYRWNDCYFPVYCCYELTSITDRSLFQSYADMIVAVEWNRDVRYYNNILSSLSRDIHCFCIQVNSSDYGDSRITKPSKSEDKDIIRTKGGINSSILVEDIDIAELRDFQLKEFSLQQKDGKYKSTPPNFDKEIVLKKIKGEKLFPKD